MIEVSLDLTTQHTDPNFQRKLREAKLACKEAAGWQCEWMYELLNSMQRELEGALHEIAALRLAATQKSRECVDEKRSGDV